MGYIELMNINKRYFRGGEYVDAVHDISLSFDKGEFAAITGASGSGKSTLMNMLGCIDFADSGRYILDGTEVFSLGDRELSEIRNKKVGFIFQGFNLIGDLTALENVELPLIYRGVNEKTRRRLSLSALERVGLAERVSHRPSEMSGGQQQRVAIARALAASPSLILADEPTGNLDPSSRDDVIGLLKKLNTEGSTVVIITHDEGVAACAERVIRISEGRVVSAK
ncbi:MAG: ABC transporter ATP-binding protein [Ruminococcus sp.]|nr:ABC transporter ATP-binding protein [Ruminococcus sp.]